MAATGVAESRTSAAAAVLSSYQVRRVDQWTDWSCYTCGVVYLGHRTLPPHKCDGCPTALWVGEGATIADPGKASRNLVRTR